MRADARRAQVNHPVQMNTLLQNIEPERRLLMKHPVYANINSFVELRIFMEHHVFAVWDFMSLLKTLQRALSCVEVPWTPVGDRTTRRLVNDIVMSEESDVDGMGGFNSHFELYIEAMRQIGADTAPIDDFIARVRHREDLEHALTSSGAPSAARNFVNSTFEVIRSGSLHRIAACFTFGREDIIPEMFRNLVDKLRGDSSAPRIDRFIYYLDRHIEVDADTHGPMAREMVTALCGNSGTKWLEAEKTAVSGIKSRVQFWDAVTKIIHQQRLGASPSVSARSGGSSSAARSSAKKVEARHPIAPQHSERGARGVV